jgi:superfamily I DNA/RNA helicase
MGEQDYVQILQALQDIPFGVGKKLLTTYLQGGNAESIARNKLHTKESYGSLAGYEPQELSDLIESLLMNKFIQLESVKGNAFWKVLCLSEKGKQEIVNPQWHKRQVSSRLQQTETEITEKDKELFKHFPFLEKYNDHQKKAILSPSPKLLCIAGAGSGKTTVLTQRISFLARYKSVPPEKILAITFTRKARQEMKARLKGIPVKVETFNSFCEKLLQQHTVQAYGKQVRMIQYSEKIQLIKQAIKSLNLSTEKVMSTYFSKHQLHGKTPDELFFTFLNDCFFILDYYKSQNKKVEDFSKKAFPYDNSLLTKTMNAPKMVYQVCKFLEQKMKQYGLRDHTDQLMDCINLFRQHSHIIPQFEHIFVDEYQDINKPQKELLNILNSPNLFCVGDPRQSIFGWRGSRIDYILDFERNYPGSEVLFLTENYRSTPKIVEVFNKAITSMKLPDLTHTREGSTAVKLLSFDTEEEEHNFISSMLLAATASRNEIFVLARTNNQLRSLSYVLASKRVPHVVRTDEVRKPVTPGPNDVVLSTIHAIKGLEASMVFVMGCNNQNFPCKASDHPVVDMVKLEEYDKEEEEKRLFYVALSRAKDTLFLTHTGSITRFVTPEMKIVLDDMKLRNPQQKTVPANGSANNEGKVNNNVAERLKQWRRDKSTEDNMPPYIIMHDTTLLEIASRTPSTLEELQTISGMGPVKVKKYGNAILDVLQG